jgi:hypothetical protein
VIDSFALDRLRFSFRAIDRLHFGKTAANTLRGAFGYALRETATDEEFRRIFAPEAAGRHPSGFADLPRPFVFRSRHLDGATIDAGECFHFDVHVFDTQRPVNAIIAAAFEQMAVKPGRMEMCSHTAEPVVLSLAPSPKPVDAITVEFLTPTELKSREEVAPEPAFPILFARVRDRIGTLQALYGSGPMDIDFRAMAERASAVQMTANDMHFRDAARHSSRTGQRHAIGGFIGSAEYEGPLTQFMPWLEAASFAGVGRQTTWGKGEIRVAVR